jgi:hypothetical protein
MADLKEQWQKLPHIRKRIRRLQQQAAITKKVGVKH